MRRAAPPPALILQPQRPRSSHARTHAPTTVPDGARSLHTPPPSIPTQRGAAGVKEANVHGVNWRCDGGGALAWRIALIPPPERLEEQSSPVGSGKSLRRENPLAQATLGDIYTPFPRSSPPTNPEVCFHAGRFSVLTSMFFFF